MVPPRAGAAPGLIIRGSEDTSGVQGAEPLVGVRGEAL